MPPFTLALAPMAGLSHAALRILVDNYGGCDHYFSEMIGAEAYTAGGMYERFYVMSEPDPRKLSLQFVAGSPEAMVTAVKKASRLPVAGIDLNMGCSAPRIVRYGGGVRWMSDPEMSSACVRKVREIVPDMRLSVKVRAGETMDLVRFLDFIRRIEDAGADLVTVHPRTRRDTLSRPCDWSLITAAARTLSIPVYGNGDIDSPARCAAMRASCGVSGVMIGREAVRSPWIFAAIKAAERAPGSKLDIDLAECIERFFALLEAYQPEDFHRSRARRFCSYITSHLSFGHRVNAAVTKAGGLAEMLDILLGYLERHPGERHPSPHI